MSDHRVNGSFLSEKVSKIRWIPQQYTSPDSFVTGGWDSPENSVKLWKLTSGNDFAGMDEPEYLPKCMAQLRLRGDITGLEFVDADHIVVATTDGFVSVLHIDRDRVAENLSESYRYRSLHRYGNDVAAPCNGLATFEHNVATVGEDGRLNILAINQNRVIASVDEADSCSLMCVTFVNQKEVFTGNRMGLVKMFDVRSDTKTAAVTSFQISCDDDKKSNGVTSLTHHPTQKYIVLSGSEEGSITVWDLRNLGYAASYLTAHESAITELCFHPTEPSKLFTASEAGELYQWSQTSAHILDGGVDGQLKYDESEQTSPWLSGERIKNKISWTPLISGIRKSINSFDASGTKIISSCDNEAVYLIENVV